MKEVVDPTGCLFYVDCCNRWSTQIIFVLTELLFCSVLTVHVYGMDLETGAVLRGNLHLVDLAGSERVDRSEAIGERLREAQHINKSLSALGDVIFSLAQRSQHVPFRNSKLTQVLQSSLGTIFILSALS